MTALPPMVLPEAPCAQNGLATVGRCRLAGVLKREWVLERASSLLLLRSIGLFFFALVFFVVDCVKRDTWHSLSVRFHPSARPLGFAHSTRTVAYRSASGAAAAWDCSAHYDLLHNRPMGWGRMRLPFPFCSFSWSLLRRL